MTDHISASIPADLSPETLKAMVNGGDARIPVCLSCFNCFNCFNCFSCYVA